MDVSAEAHQQMMSLADGYVRTQLLYVAAMLDIGGALADGPRTGAEIASVAGADADALHRILRGLAADGVVEELDGGRFGLTAAGALLRGDVPGSVRGAVLARGGVYYRAASGLLDAVRRGGSAFEHVHGHGFFEHLSRHPEQEAAFQSSMVVRSTREAVDVVAAYDFGRFRHVVDVGGGQGILLASILQAHPHLRGTLLDRPDAVAHARRRFETADLLGRCDAVARDFFVEVPAGGDAYLLSRVLHDWDDDGASRILACCRREIAADGTLLVVEAILPERAREQPAAIAMDVNMLILLDGHERTVADFRSLLAGAGFELRRVVPTASGAVSVIEAVPA